MTAEEEKQFAQKIPRRHAGKIQGLKQKQIQMDANIIIAFSQRRNALLKQCRLAKLGKHCKNKLTAMDARPIIAKLPNRRHAPRLLAQAVRQARIWKEKPMKKAVFHIIAHLIPAWL